MPPDEQPREQIRVLLVDYHEMMRESIARLLSDRHDMVVVGLAGTGVEAIALAAEQTPDVVVVDYMLPDMNGIDVVRQLTKARPDIRTVLLTGSANTQELVTAAIYAGCSTIVEKTRAV
ncbi:MAG TPA: response regulator transcription factor, partial [Acidimicrobiales bacterium]|nr:response regulator transcription factor [Acidimicrobiales bacterium]